MRELLIPKHVFDEIASTVLETEDCLETGVTLFGTRLEGFGEPRYVVLAISDPGKSATHEPAHYSGDESYASAIYAALGSAMPGIRWLGELHVHPRGMTWLSGGDLSTVRHLLTDTDLSIRLEEFVAGVMQRRNGTVDIYPFHFTRERLKGKAMEIRILDVDDLLVRQARVKAIEEGGENGRSRVRAEPRGSRAALPEASGHRWLREWRKRVGVYGRKVWGRKTDTR
jgi:hypothetical protein